MRTRTGNVASEGRAICLPIAKPQEDSLCPPTLETGKLYIAQTDSVYAFLRCGKGRVNAFLARQPHQVTDAHGHRPEVWADGTTSWQQPEGR
jgi:hypothetical protein